MYYKFKKVTQLQTPVMKSLFKLIKSSQKVHSSETKNQTKSPWDSNEKTLKEWANHK